MRNFIICTISLLLSSVDAYATADNSADSISLYKNSAIENTELSVPTSLSSGQTTPLSNIDESVLSENSDVQDSTVYKRPGLIKRIINYFDRANDENPEKKFDVTFLGGPSYSVSTSVQIAVIAAGLYRSKRNETTRQSNISLFGQGSVTGFYRVGIFGEHYAPENQWRLNYKGDFAHFPLKFWGLTYDNQRNNANESSYTELQSEFFVEWQWRFGRNIYIGPSFNFNYGKATKAERPELWDNEKLSTLNYGFGVILSIDTRDYPTNASKGIQFTLKQNFFPAFIGNKEAFSETEFIFNYYKQWWKSGIVAFQLHGWSTYGHTPWTMLPTVDSSNGIRGYYEGRYRAKQEADLVVELRQHVWRRNGIVVWGGLGTVFNQFKQIDAHRLLPTYGIGYRWEFKKKVNIRADIGFGKGSSAVKFGIHETF